jgi:hypothetical protein
VKQPAGYSRKPLAAKLGIKPGMLIATVAAPRNYRALLGRLPAGVKVQTFKSGPGPRPGVSQPQLVFIHCFATERRVLAAQFPGLERALAPAGMLWISWPKGTSRLATDLTENVVRDVGLARGLVDVKVCAVDDVWSGLKFVRRLKDR